MASQVHSRAWCEVRVARFELMHDEQGTSATLPSHHSACVAAQLSQAHARARAPADRRARVAEVTVTAELCGWLWVQGTHGQVVRIPC